MMLQQTRVETVVPYFQRFLARFPDVRSLAEVSLQEVLKQWEGLGYYSRARHIHRTSHILVRDFGGNIPKNPEILATLPGLGPYSVAALGSFAFGLPLAVVDGNIMRIFTRLLAWSGDIGRSSTKQKLQVMAEALLPPAQAAVVNEAWMELGALICSPRQPKCPACPMRGVCRAFELKQMESFPKKSKRKNIPHKVVGAAVILNRKGQILIAQRHPEGGFLAGLWEFPGGKRLAGETIAECIRRELREEMGVNLEIGPHLVTIQHAYSHFTIELHAYFARIRAGRPQHLECADHAWVRAADFNSYPFSKADVEIIRAIQRLPEPPRWQASWS